MRLTPLHDVCGIKARTDVVRTEYFLLFRVVYWQAWLDASVMLFFYYGRGHEHVTRSGRGGVFGAGYKPLIRRPHNGEPHQHPHVLANDSIMRSLGASLGRIFDAGSGGYCSIICLR